ncbi:BlaI/MecI/CopY family transcriptional regulator [Sinosporangium siamense]|uniref:Transcriptional regulator n=1 Tax=Sinosporangium siamense TaxID=1367973 RepID=A0A919RN88_9ACTN|nr:BlaI/MecI/CopY family transcriptional regulator [Sinosporangium siamense]GII96895.1 hypothetical protein Ssi02_71260 [Sinosporangium siamense]
MRLGNLERSIMEALWDRPEGMLAQDVAEVLPSRPAVTTVLTVLVRLTGKGLVHRERQGRAHLYRAAGDKDSFVAEVMRAALDEAGDLETAVQRFVGTVSPEVAAALRDALEGRDGPRPRLS